jgi:pimeloyl-ACP methyl ester carboxylesterase
MIFLMVFGAFVSYLVITNGGTVTVENTSFYGASGNLVSANLFIPPTATSATPAPGVLAIHGFDNNKDFMTNTAMELARRGFVVLAIDSAGHGDSPGASGAFNYDAVDGLAYLRSLAYVNTKEIGMVGMSMGGTAITGAALASPTGYESLFYMDSSPQFPSVGVPLPESQLAALKNVAVQLGLAEEFGGGFAYVATGSQVPTSYYLKELFNTTTTITPGAVYGNIATGTSRILYSPWTDHPQSTDNTASITNVVTWFEMTLGPTSTALANSNMIFPVKQLFLMISFIAALIFMFAFGGYLLQTESFKDLVEPLPEYKGFKGSGYWIGAIIVTALGPLLYLWGFNGINGFIGTYLFPQGFTNTYASWYILVAFVATIILVLSYFLSLRKAGVTLNDLGLRWSAHKIAKSLIFAILVLLPIYATLVYCYSLFETPFTFGIDGFPMIPLVLEPLNSVRAFFLPSYFLTFLPIFLVYGAVFAGFVRYKKGNASLGKEMIINSIILSLGSILLLLYYYIPLYAGMPQTLTNWPFLPAYAVLGLDMIYFIPVPIFSIVAACLLTYYFRKTGKVWPGALLITGFITWYLVAFSAFTLAVV